MRRTTRFLLVCIGVCIASACSHLPELPRVAERAAPQATLGLTPRERVSLAIDMLDRGDASQAEVELRAALSDQPNSRGAQRLLDQITGDPHALLPSPAQPYTVRAGETMSMLAERFLGDALMFYALARYNGLQAPNQLAAGQRLMIPRVPGVRATSAPAPSATPPPPAGSATPAPGANAARANQLRLQALQQLNAGNMGGAIALLRQAQALDSTNPAIQRDLDRALRLQAALSAGPG